MGFNKRFINKEIIDFYIRESKSFSILFKADAFIFMDKESSKVYDWYSSGLSDSEIKLNWDKLILENENI